MSCGLRILAHPSIREFAKLRTEPHVGPVPWPVFPGQAALIGVSPSGKVTVYIDAALPQAMQNGQDLLAAADTIGAANEKIFGTSNGPVNVIVWALNGPTNGEGGALHGGCDWTTGQNIEVDAAFGRSDRVLALFEAELSECSMGGNLCGMSTGEALSRWCAAVNPPGFALGDFLTAPSWQQAGMPNWVDHTDPTDQNPVSTGCGMAFLSFLQSRGLSLNQIAPAMVSLGDGGTFSQLYQKLTGKTTAWADFQGAVANLPGPITTEDPFKGVPVPPNPPNPPTPPTPPTPGTIQQIVDAAFAWAEQQVAGSPLLLMALQWVQHQVDAWFAANPATARMLAAAGTIQTVIDQIFDQLIAAAQRPLVKMALRIAKSFVDAYLATHPLP